jgi:hypothetical protein
MPGDLLFYQQIWSYCNNAAMLSTRNLLKLDVIILQILVNKNIILGFQRNLFSQRVGGISSRHVFC